MGGPPADGEKATLMQGRLARWARLWGVAGLEKEVRVVTSSRMTTTLGRCLPERAEIRLSERLSKDLAALLDEVLCHEFAHFVVYRRLGRDARPHGPEWRSLVAQAGFPTRTQVERTTRQPAKRVVFVHRCPVCGASRVAGRRVGSWRCLECVEAGLDGRLEVTTR